MAIRSLLMFMLIMILLVNSLNGTKSSDHQEELIDTMNQNTPDDERLAMMIKSNDDSDDEYEDLIKRNKYAGFHLSPLWLSRRTRTNRFYGKPLWISRPGR